MKLELPVALLPVRQFFSKHNAVLFISFILLLLALAVYVLYTTSQTAPDEAPTPTIGKFDEATIGKIKELHNSSDSSNLITFPTPRSNPFTE